MLLQQTESFVRAGLGACVLILAASCDSGTIGGPKDSAPLSPLYSTASSSVTVAYGIAGVGVNDAGAQIYIAAAKMSDGSVRGAFFAPGALVGTVVELVRPTPTLNYWW